MAWFTLGATNMLRAKIGFCSQRMARNTCSWCSKHTGWLQEWFPQGSSSSLPLKRAYSCHLPLLNCCIGGFPSTALWEVLSLFHGTVHPGLQVPKQEWKVLLYAMHTRDPCWGFCGDRATLKGSCQHNRTEWNCVVSIPLEWGFICSEQLKQLANHAVSAFLKKALCPQNQWSGSPWRWYWPNQVLPSPGDFLLWKEAFQCWLGWVWGEVSASEAPEDWGARKQESGVYSVAFSPQMRDVWQHWIFITRELMGSCKGSLKSSNNLWLNTSFKLAGESHFSGFKPVCSPQGPGRQGRDKGSAELSYDCAVVSKTKDGVWEGPEASVIAAFSCFTSPLSSVPAGGVGLTF